MEITNSTNNSAEVYNKQTWNKEKAEAGCVTKDRFLMRVDVIVNLFADGNCPEKQKT